MFQALLDACFAGAQGWDIQFCLLTLIALSIAQGIMEHQLGRRQSSLTYVWVVLFMAIIAAPAMLHEAGLDSEVESYADLTWTAFWCGVAVLARPEVFHLAGRIGEKVGFSRHTHATAHAVLDALLLGAAAHLAVMSLEVAWNENFPKEAFYPTFLAWTFVFLVLVILYFVCQRRGGGAAVGVAAFAAIGMAVYFTYEFKGTIITPGDLYGLGTAAAVAGGYEYAVTQQLVTSATYATVGMGLCAWVTPWLSDERQSVAQVGARGAINLVCAALCLAALAWVSFASRLTHDYDIPLDYWSPVASTQENGFVPSFLAKVQDLKLVKPKDYDKQGAIALEARYAAAYDTDPEIQARRAEAVAQFDELQPTIVCIMNESYANMADFPIVAEAGYAGPTFFQGESDALFRGGLAVDMYGGGTSNSEFSFLTGNSIAFIGESRIVYPMYNLSDVDSIPKQLAAAGYSTTAIHPNLATNWSRDTAYRQLGFDRFLDISYYPKGSPSLHWGLTDAVTYDTILESIERNRNRPQFFFDVTMQNHGGYTANNIPEDKRVYYQPEGLDEETTAQLNEYLACIESSDRDLEQLLEQLRQVDRPVVVIFFGDHMPGFARDVSSVAFPGNGDIYGQERLYTTSYFVWANYDVAGMAQEGTYAQGSISFLSANVLDWIGAPLTDYQKAQVMVSRSYPALNDWGWLDQSGTWHELDRNISSANAPKDEESDYEPLPQELLDYQTMQYYEFADRV